MIKRRWVRLTLGVILGGAAGLSFNSSILPMAISTLGSTDSFFVRWALGEYAAYMTLLWAIGGWAVAKTGIPKAGAVILGIVGVASGLFLCYLALGTEMSLLLISAIAGGVYGLVGGALLGRILQGDDGTAEPRAKR